MTFPHFAQKLLLKLLNIIISLSLSRAREMQSDQRDTQKKGVLL